MATICDMSETYSYRGIGAAFRNQGLVVNGKKVRRLMREHHLQPRQRRRYVATTNSNHNSPIHPDRAPDIVLTGGLRDISYITITAVFVYLAAILDASSRRVVGYAINRSIDTRLTMAALKATSYRGNRRQVACITPPAGRNTHSEPTTGRSSSIKALSGR